MNFETEAKKYREQFLEDLRELVVLSEQGRITSFIFTRSFFESCNIF